MAKDDLISRAALLKELRKEQRECEKDGEEFGGESILFAEAFGDVIEMVKRMPAADAVPAEKYDMLVRRIQHLLESDYICSFDEKDSRTGEYKRDIREAAAPVVHARWVFDRPYHYMCSVCSRMLGVSALTMAYCPFCGAKMDGGAEDDRV